MISSAPKDEAARRTIEEAQLSLQGVTKSFGRVTAVHELNLKLGKGEFLSLLGPSGSGKTTVLRLIAGLEEPDRGRIAIGGQVVADAQTGVWVPPERRGIGIVFQDYALFPHMTALQNVAFGLRGCSRRERTKRAMEALEQVGLKDLARRYPHELSGGEQQRVALARALAPGPEVLLLDEPFSNLDKNLRTWLRAEVKEILTAAGVTVVFVTHDQEEAFFMGGRIAVLSRGRLEQLGTPEELYYRPATRFVAEFIGRADFLPAIRCREGLETELGFFPLEAAENGAPEELEILIRPDRVEIEPDPQGQAVIVARRFVGPQKLYCLELPSGRRLHSLQSATVTLEEGSRVRVRIPMDMAICFPKGHNPARKPGKT
jgi:iron(III) transport system ATP-binding protein